MRAIAYNIQAEEKELLVRANAKRFKLTIISNGLDEETSAFSIGKEVVIVSQEDPLTFAILSLLKERGVRKIITRSFSTHHIDKLAAKTLGIEILHVENNLNREEMAWQIIDLLAL